MAELATPSAAAISTGNTGTTTLPATSHKVKPEKPDEEKYQAELAAAEKENAVVMEAYVRYHLPAYTLPATRP